ncbi:MAG: nucleotide exchange factor GrpE [Candidatus Spechtbacteria bacterium]|nr:nucleotide exchange factor GrpE [Candidatus Spechtbacteria bacterium]
MEENNKNEDKNAQDSEGRSLRVGTDPPEPDDATYILEEDGLGEREVREKLKKTIERLRQEKEEYLDGWQRERASFSNFRKDQDKRMGEFREMAVEDVIHEILAVLDNIVLAEKHASEDLRKSQWFQGIVGIEKQLRQILDKYHVEEIDVEGKSFDPSLHEAITEEESSKEGGMIVEEIQKGYRIGERVIRPSKVKVAK